MAATLYPTIIDGMIDENDVLATNASTATLRCDAVGTKPIKRRKPIILANIGVGPDLSSCSLILKVQTAPSAAMTIQIDRLRRGQSGASWTNYDDAGLFSWAIAGAQDTSSDVYLANSFTKVVNTGDTTVTINDASLLAMANLARADDGWLRLVMTAVSSDTVIFHSMEAIAVDNRPTMPIAGSTIGQGWLLLMKVG